MYQNTVSLRGPQARGNLPVASTEVQLLRLYQEIAAVASSLAMTVLGKVIPFSVIPRSEATWESPGRMFGDLR